MAILFQCSCGQRISVTDKKAGAEVQCPRCNKTNIAPELPKRKSELEDSQTSLPVPTGKTDPQLRKIQQPQPTILPKTPRKPFVGRSLFSVVIALIIFWTLIGLIVAGTLIFLKMEMALIIGLGIVAPAVLLLFMLAKLGYSKNSVKGSRDVDLLFRMVKLVSWDEVEGVILQKEKSIHYVDDMSRGGGMVTLFPVLGDRLLLRQPLTYQSLEFRDDLVFSRENMTLSIRGSVDWRITDLERFHKLMLRDAKVSSQDDSRDDASEATAPISESQVESNRAWLRSIVEELARAEVVKLNAGSMVAEGIANELNRTMTGADTTVSGLAERIQKQFAEKSRPYGIEIRKVSIDSISLPKEVRASVLDASRQYYASGTGTASYEEFIAYLNDWFANARKLKR